MCRLLQVEVQSLLPLALRRVLSRLLPPGLFEAPFAFLRLLLLATPAFAE
jgi:hypothetical protein